MNREQLLFNARRLAAISESSPALSLSVLDLVEVMGILPELVREIDQLDNCLTELNAFIERDQKAQREYMRTHNSCPPEEHQ